MSMETLASAQDLKRLHELMAQVKKLAPWEYMEESDNFGIKLPDSEEINFVSVMGMAGEHFAIALYLGAEGIHQFWHVQELGEDTQPEDILNLTHLQASFEDREALEDLDRQQIKELGLKYRGKNAWVMFRSFRPAYAPYFIEKHEAKLLEVALEQVLEIAPRFKENSEMLVPQVEHEFFIRIAEEGENGLQWHEERRVIPPPQVAKEIDLITNPKIVEKYKKIKKSEIKLAATVFMSLGQVREKNQRPYFPYILLAIDAINSMIITADVLQPLPSIEAMWGKVPMRLFEKLAQSKVRPSEIYVNDRRLYATLKPFAKELDFKLAEAQFLPMLDMVRSEFEMMFMR